MAVSEDGKNTGGALGRRSARRTSSSKKRAFCRTRPRRGFSDSLVKRFVQEKKLDGRPRQGSLLSNGRNRSGSHLIQACFTGSGREPRKSRAWIFKVCREESASSRFDSTSLPLSAGRSKEKTTSPPSPCGLREAASEEGPGTRTRFLRRRVRRSRIPLFGRLFSERAVSFPRVASPPRRTPLP